MGDPVLWECRACPAGARTVDDKIPMHLCPGGPGILIPLTRVGERVKVEVIEREDFIGGDHVQTDARGRPVMAVVTTRDDGQDVQVFAPTAWAAHEEVK